MVKLNDFEMVELLLKLKPEDLDVPGMSRQTPLCAAAENGNTKIMRLLLESGSEAVDTPKEGGCTPLHCAAGGGHNQAVKLLLRSGSGVLDALTNGGETPLDKALARRHQTTVRLLRALGASASAPPKSLRAVEMLTLPLDEKYVEDTRYKIYFQQSLTGQLLICTL